MPSLPNDESHFNTDVLVQPEQDFITNTVVINSDNVQGSSATLWTVTVFLCLLISCVLGKHEKCGGRVEGARDFRWSGREETWIQLISCFAVFCLWNSL